MAVELGREAYPTREYESFTLPAGIYESLRVTIGAGGGPQLVVRGCSPRSAPRPRRPTAPGRPGRDGGAALPRRELEIRFRLVELWGELMALLGIK